MTAFVHKIFSKAAHALSGILSATKNDLSFRIDLLLGLVFLSIGYLLWPLTTPEILILLLSWVLILITELQNTSIETALDRIHPERHREIGMSKDIAAGAVFIAWCFACVVVVMLFVGNM